MAKSFEDLSVYKKAYEAALGLHKISLDLPKNEQFALADQMRRASKSVCANLAEGFAKQHISVPEFKRFIVMCMGSSEEMRVWLSFCRDLNYVDTNTADHYLNAYDEISKMLNGLYKNWKLS